MGEHHLPLPLGGRDRVGLFIVVLGAFAVRTPSLLQDSGFTPTGSQSERGIAFLEENLDMSAASLDIVLQSTEGKI